MRYLNYATFYHTKRKCEEENILVTSFIYMCGCAAIDMHSSDR